MNPNIILAILERKGIITKDEALATAEFVANSPQSTYYGDAQNAVKEFIEPGLPAAVSSGDLPKIDLSNLPKKSEVAKKSTDKKEQ